MTPIQRNNLSPIVGLFNTTDAPSKLVLKKSAEAYQCQVVSLKTSDSNDDSLTHLKSLIGATRIQRLFQREVLAPYAKAFEENRLVIDRPFLEALFLELGNVWLDDLEEAASLEGREIQSLSISEADKLYRSLIPFEAFNDLFFGNLPENAYVDRVSSSGKGLEGLRERVRIQLDARDYHLKDPPESEERQWVHRIEVLTSRLGDREPPIGTLIRCEDGYLTYKALFTGSGAYVNSLQNIHTQKYFLVCRGTAFRTSATGGLLSGMNNLLLQPGLAAIQAVWPKLKAYIAANSIQEIDIYGKSQGGAHAQALAPLIQAYTSAEVKRLVTYASIGVGPTVEKIFNETFGGNQPEISAIFNEGGLPEDSDFIPFVGGLHVGNQRPASSINVYLIMPDGTHPTDTSVLSTYSKLYHFGTSFLGTHPRQTTLGPFGVTRIDGDRARPYFLRGVALEPVRKVTAATLDILTLGFFNSYSYEDFFRSFTREQ